MEIVIASPTGGAFAKVNPEGQLVVQAIDVPPIHYASERGQAYGCSAQKQMTQSTLTVTTTAGYVLVIQNMSATPITIHRITGGVDGITQMAIVKNPTIGTLGNYLVETPNNLNFDVKTPADANVYSWDEAGTGITGISGGTIIALIDFAAAGPIAMTFDDEFILGRGSIMALRFQGIGAAREVGIASVFYHHPSVT